MDVLAFHVHVPRASGLTVEDESQRRFGGEPVLELALEARDLGAQLGDASLQAVHDVLLQEGAGIERRRRVSHGPPPGADVARQGP